MRVLLPSLIVVAGCSGTSSSDGSAAPATAEAAAIPSIPSSGEAWGAVFWKGDVAWKVGGGLDTIGPRGRTTATLRSPAAGHCGGLALDNAAPHAVITAPPGSAGAAPTKPAVISAATVEAAAWRLDEVLPGRDRFTPVDPDAAPALQRGVEVGSVVKVRRYGGPPVLLVGGRRGSVAALIILDREATRVEDQLLVDGVTAVPRVLPPADLDSDGHLETALFTGTETLLARLTLTSATATATALEWWACPEDALQ